MGARAVSSADRVRKCWRRRGACGPHARRRARAAGEWIAKRSHRRARVSTASAKSEDPRSRTCKARRPRPRLRSRRQALCSASRGRSAVPFRTLVARRTHGRARPTRVRPPSSAGYGDKRGRQPPCALGSKASCSRPPRSFGPRARPPPASRTRATAPAKTLRRRLSLSLVGEGGANETSDFVRLRERLRMIYQIGLHVNVFNRGRSIADSGLKERRMRARLTLILLRSDFRLPTSAIVTDGL